MSGAPTSGDDRTSGAPPDAEVLARAGWSEAEVTWEHIEETAAEALMGGDWQEAASLWAVGLDLARATFEAADPRLAASLANQAAALRRAGQDAAAGRLFDEALAVWARTGPWVLALAPERRARSSTYHLRLETRYPGGYDRHARTRYTALAEEGCAALEALREGRASSRGALARWRKERPAGYVDARKLLAAVLLLADPAD
jgi:hypothetical protein